MLGEIKFSTVHRGMNFVVDQEVKEFTTTVIDGSSDKLITVTPWDGEELEAYFESLRAWKRSRLLRAFKESRLLKGLFRKDVEPYRARLYMAHLKAQSFSEGEPVVFIEENAPVQAYIHSMIVVGPSKSASRGY